MYRYRVEFDGLGAFFDTLHQARHYASGQSIVYHNLTVFLYEKVDDTSDAVCIAYYRNGSETLY